MPTPTAHRTVSSVAAILIVAAAGACASDIDRFSGPDGDRRFYEARCGFCHVAHHPTDYTPEEWPELVEDMAGRAGLTRVQQKRVLDYLVRESAAPR